MLPQTQPTTLRRRIHPAEILSDASPAIQPDDRESGGEEQGAAWLRYRAEGRIERYVDPADRRFVTPRLLKVESALVRPYARS